MASRRAVLASLSAAVLPLAGCIGGPEATEFAPENDRSTATSRDPRPLDATGTWPLRAADPANTARTDLAGVPADATAYWHLRRLESGPAVVADGRLFHLAELGEDPERRTQTATLSEGSTYVQRGGDPALVARDARTGDIEWYLGLDGSVWAWPAVGEKTVVAGATGHLIAADPTGDRQWDRDIGEARVRGQTLVDDTVYVATSEEVRAHALADGAEQWRAGLSEYTDGVAVADGTVYVSTAAETLHAFDAATGDVRWAVDTVGETPYPPTVDGDTVFVGGGAGEAAAHATADGSLRWRTDVGPNGHGGVAVTGDTVLYAGGGALRALDRSDGTERWQHEASEGRPVAASVADGVVYGGVRGPYEPELYAVGLDSGDQLWSVSLPQTTVEGDMVDGGLAAPPAVVDGAVYAYAVDGLYAVGAA